MPISQNMKKARTEAGLSQIALANKLGVSQKDISRWENGERVPTIQSLKKFCEVLKISADEILDIKHTTESEVEK